MKLESILIPILTVCLTGCGGNINKPKTEKIYELISYEIEAPEDLNKALNQEVRRALMQEEGLSTNAKNIRIIASDGTITLRGLVENNQEKNRIEDAVKDVDGVDKVDNQLDVKDIEMGS